MTDIENKNVEKNAVTSKYVVGIATVRAIGTKIIIDLEDKDFQKEIRQPEPFEIEYYEELEKQGVIVEDDFHVTVLLTQLRK